MEKGQWNSINKKNGLKQSKNAKSTPIAVVGKHKNKLPHQSFSSGDTTAYIQCIRNLQIKNNVSQYK